MKSLIFLFLSILTLAGCVTNPETGKSSFIITSEAEENAMGAQAYQQTLSKEKISTNQRWTTILNRVGKRIAAAAHKPDFKWEFTLIESKQQNAFALPGGKVAFYTGILDVAQTEAGIAVVMGHEVAHATARHGGQRISQALGTQMALGGVSILMGKEDTPKKQILLAALGLGAQVGVMLPFSRSNEAEADQIGLVYMSRAGYDPREAPKFWQRMMGNKGGGEPPEILSTHPSSSRRIRELTADLPKVIPIYEKSPRYGLGEKL